MRYLPLLLLVAALPLLCDQSSGTLDPAFQTVPFDQWISEHNPPRFHWTASVPHAGLSFHQRLESSILVEIDGRDLQTRRNDGELVVFFQVTAGDGARFQGHAAIPLNKLADNVKDSTIQTQQPAFFLPGDYQLAIALFDTGSREHDTLQMRFKIPAAPANSLLQTWQNLPSVEFIRDRESPDSWFLPDIQGRLREFANLPAAASLNVLLNVAPSAPKGSGAVPSDGLSALLPTLKVFSETGSAQLSEQIEVLDLARHRAVFKTEIQGLSQTLDWPTLKSSLHDANTGSIDVHSLADSQQDARFFVSEVRRILRTEAKPGVLVILSAPIAFQAGQDLDPISLESLPNCRVFYLRYHAAAPRSSNFPESTLAGRGRGMRMSGPTYRRGWGASEVVDQLAPTLKPLNPKVIDVGTPEDFTKALNEIQKALAG